MTRTLLIAATIVLAASAQAQPLRFDVASVKKAESGGPPGDIPRNMDTAPGHFLMRNVPMRYMLEWAYDLKDFEIAGPDWIKGEERYDVEARGPANTTDEQLKGMLQTLLTERFQMKSHRETKPMAAYVLMPGKGAAKVTAAADDEQQGLVPAKDGSSVKFQKFPISRLTFLLTRRMDHPVLDLTGLKGIYDYTVDLSGLSEFSGPPSEKPVTSIFIAIQQDLNLKLESRKQQPVEIFVVDSANKVPIAN